MKRNREINSYNAWGDFFTRRNYYNQGQGKDLAPFRFARLNKIFKGLWQLFS